jgi:hypothetical protein
VELAEADGVAEAEDVAETAAALLPPGLANRK